MKTKKDTKNSNKLIIITIFIVFSIITVSNYSYANCNNNGICIIAFNSSQTWDVPTGINNVDILIVAGGGGGAGNTAFSSAGGGGGGAGGLIYQENISINQSNYNIIVGKGGAGIDQEGTPASNGEDSKAFNLTAIGGGGGILTSASNNAPASDGGSGGGGRDNPAGNALQPSSIWGGFGNDGSRNSRDDGGGGGGGAGSQPADISGNDGGNGGNGLYYGDKFTNQFGNNGYFAGGGGGGGDADGTLGVGGNGGGGNGSSARDGIAPTNGIPNTGGGGGGGSSAHAGADGGSGIVIIKFKDNITPNIEIISPKNKTYNNSKTQLLNISATDNIETDKIWYNWNGTNITYTNPINITFNDGIHTLTAWTNDTAGNINTTNITFTIDTTKPNINVISPTNQIYNKSKILLNISATDNIETDKIWYNWNGTNITYTNPINITFDDGIHTLTAWTNDTARNINTTNITFIIDTIKPSINISSPINNLYDSLTILLNISTTDNIETDKIWYNWNGTNITYTNPINITFNDGINTLTAWTNDTAGNINTTNISFEVTDNPIKNITLITPKNHKKLLALNQIELIWNITNILNQTMDCKIFVNSINIANQTCNSNTNNSFILNVTRGNYNWSINASNSANYHLKSQTQNFSVIKQNHIKINKLIRSESTNLYLVHTNIHNIINQTNKIKIFEFIDNSLTPGSFTPPFNFINTTSKIKYNGSIYGWNFDLPKLSYKQLNYSITKNLNYWKTSKNYIIGFE
ncbi:MAG: glycine-rich domain-containing protein [Nanoarchaeota archaeon]